MSEGLLLDQVDLRIGEEVISCHMPLMIILRIRREMDLGGCTEDMNQTKKTVRFRWTECLKEDFIYTLCDDSSVLCIQGIQSSLQRGELNNVVKILDFMVKRAGAKMRQYTGKNRDKCHWLDEECSENKRMLRRALRGCKEKTKKAE
jgi:hypothetical protein